MREQQIISHIPLRGGKIEISSTISRYGANAAHSVRVEIMTAASIDDDVYSPAESASYYLGKPELEQMIALLQVHLARLDPEPAPAEIKTATVSP